MVFGGGELYVWGTNENGCLGIGSTDVAHLPERVEGPFLRHSVSEKNFQDILVFCMFQEDITTNINSIACKQRYPVVGSIQQQFLVQKS
ncbi:hypothetical protein MTR67_025135 [Solanum verrucosum]|uniref:Uncharacterized protein n=1 Tax=Solanum verrucosum TaxID=315347 RepID=A0AAF0TYP8_SOLVR|nr:hypothetical protein MTR67_025135 [Solanum verrucosum]